MSSHGAVGCGNGARFLELSNFGPFGLAAVTSACFEPKEVPAAVLFHLPGSIGQKVLQKAIKCPSFCCI